MWIYKMVYGNFLSQLALITFPPVVLFLFWHCSRMDLETTKYPKIAQMAQLIFAALILIFMWAGIHVTLLKGG